MRTWAFKLKIRGKYVSILRVNPFGLPNLYPLFRRQPRIGHGTGESTRTEVVRRGQNRHSPRRHLIQHLARVGQTTCPRHVLRPLVWAL